MILYINLNWEGKNWEITENGKRYELPPGGWYARQGKDFLEFSALVDAHRVDFVDSPEYVYLDGHGQTVEMPGFRTDRQLIHWKRGPKAGQTLTFPE